jgi:hypothetical protein
MASLLKLARLASQIAAAGKALERALVPPRNRFERVLAFAAHRGFAVSVGISAALILGLLAYSSDAAWLAWLRIALGLVLIAEGLLLATDWRGARRLTLWRMRRRDTTGATLPFTHRMVRKLAGPGLQLLGVLWLGAGILAATIALPQLV